MKKRHDDPLLNKVSFGLDIRHPRNLQVRTAYDFLTGVRDGEWREHIEPVRALHGTLHYDVQKRKLPYVTLSGRFKTRRNDDLIQHSGIMGIDVDRLTAAKCVNALQQAVADPYCVAAFHSVSGFGVRLLFRVPPMTPAEHFSIFDQVAMHVRDKYHLKPDGSGRDVSRPCFVSCDRTMVLNQSAKILPVKLELPGKLFNQPACNSPQRVERQTIEVHLPNKEKVLSRPPNAKAKLAKTELGAARLIGLQCSPFKQKADGTRFTDKTLFQMSKRLAVYFVKKQVARHHIEALIAEAFKGWMLGAKKNKYRLRGTPEEYLNELRAKVRHALKADWTKRAANHWRQWRDHPQYPNLRPGEERLEFAIRKHCEQNKTKDFFIGSRDAAAVACYRSNKTGATLLKKLRKSKIIALTDGGLLRNAFNYKLLN